MYKLRKNGLKLRCYTRRINMFELKRFIAFIAAGLLLVAAKYYPSPLISGKYGKVIYYDDADCEIVEGSAYSFARTDCTGGEQTAAAIIKDMRATIVFTEITDGEKIFYCRSPKLPKSVYVRGKKINLAVVVRGDFVAAGSPLIKGSY